MKKFLLVLGAAALLTATACGSRTTQVPGAGSVTTTEEGGKTQVTVAGPEGQQATVETSQDGKGTTVHVTGPDGEAKVAVSGSEGFTDVAASVSEDEGGEPGDEHGTVTVAGKDGSTTFKASSEVAESDFDVPFYPGAEVLEGGVHESSAAGRTVRVAGAELVTRDSVDKVADFYGGKLKGANRMSTSVDGQHSVVFVPQNPMSGTTVTITSRDGATRIVLARQGT